MPPSVVNDSLSKWTASGKAKREGKDRQNLIPIEDYEFDLTKMTAAKGYYQFPPANHVFTGPAPESYLRFRSLWCLQKRLIPTHRYPIAG